MTKPWNFDQPLDEKTPTSSTEERAKIAALFKQTEAAPTEEVDYVSAFEMEQQKSKVKVESEVKKESSPVTPQSSSITNDYKQYLAQVIAQNKEDIVQSQKKIEELHQLIDEKNKHNKKLQAISVAIDDL
ncbi:chemotaxis protein [Carnobacteriaceae bacterium zg-ZUI78]|nr:chemotaxis protein [Carnobacteriaceae bacterium zg-ZUI78]